MQQIGINSTGSVVSVQIAPPKDLPPVLSESDQPEEAAPIREAASRLLYFYHVEQDTVSVFDYGELGRMPLTHAWDGKEPRLVCVDTCVDACAEAAGRLGEEAGVEKVVDGPKRAVALMFVDPAVGCVMQEL